MVEPDDVHVPALIQPKGKRPAGQAYKDKLLSLTKQAMEPDALSSAIKTARAHAGGKAKAMANAKGAPMMAFSSIFTGRGTWDKTTNPGPRLFIELGEDGLTDWIQVAPGPGKFNSPKYGAVEITPKTLQNFKENFDAGVYQEHIPIDAEHKTKLSGALAYYRELEIAHDGKPGLWAKVELTERGQTLLDAGGFKYFSPEFYDEWEDPADGKVYTDVITGGAFTTRPFFKDKALQPIAASELQEFAGDFFKNLGGDSHIHGGGPKHSHDGGDASHNHEKAMHGDGLGMETHDSELEEDMDGLSDIIQDMVADGLTDDEITNAVGKAVDFARSMEAAYTRINNPMEGLTMTEANPATTPVATAASAAVAAPDEAKAFAEERTAMQAQLKTMAEQNEALAKQMSEMAARDRARQFTEIVTGKGGGNDGAPHWFGEPDKHVAMLEKLHKAFGEDSAELKEYIEGQNAVAKAMSASAAMAPIGKTSHEPVGAEATAMGKIKAFAEEKNISIEKATAAVLSANPEIYAEYDREFRRQAESKG